MEVHLSTKKIKTICISLVLLLSLTINGFSRDLKKLQQDFLDLKFGMFIHFNMSTFGPGGWSTGLEDPLLFNPTEMDFGQWADAAASAHMKYAILTVKHTGGWCLWDSKYTDHDISMFKNYKNGKGDMVKEFIEAFRKRGIKVGLYYCFPLANPRWKNYGTLPIEGYTKGKADANTFMKNQFTELLSNYGDIDMVWIDQSKTNNGGVKPGDWLDFKSHIHNLQPNCLVIANNATDYELSDILSNEYPYSLELPKAYNTNPSEVCDKLQQGWFTNNGDDAPPIRNADYIVNRMLLPINYNRSNYLLNCAPNGKGLMPESVVKILKEVGEAWNPNMYNRVDVLVNEIPNDKDMISLTFNDQGDASFIPLASKLLNENKAKGTFFVVGDNANEQAEVLKKLVQQNHEIGNYSMSKTNLDSLKKGRDMLFELKNAQKEINSITGNEPLSFRAPLGHNENLWNVLNYLQIQSYGSTVKVNSSTDINKVLSEVKSGSIIEIDAKAENINILEQLLNKLNSKAYNIVTLAELSKNGNIKSGGSFETGME